MSYRLLFPLLFCLFATFSPAAAQTTDADKLATLQREVRQLRFELIQQRIEFQHWKVAQLETESQRAREERERLEVEERAVQQAIVEADPSDQEAIVSPRTELIENALKKVQAQQAVNTQHEAELREKLTREQTALQELEKRAKQLKADA